MGEPQVKPATSIDVHGTAMPQVTVSAERGREDISLRFAEIGVGVSGKDLSGEIDVRGAYPMPGDTKVPVQLGQAFVAYNRDVFGFSAGLFNTLVGGEPVNPALYAFITRSYLYSNGPVTDLGARLRLGPEFVSLIFGAYTSNFSILGDNNRVPAGMVGLHISLKKFSLLANGLVGPEQDDNNKDNRFMGDLVIAYTPHEMVDLGLNVDVAREKQGEAYTHWEGGALYLTVTPRDWVQVAGRGEVFHDPYGSISGDVGLLALGVTTSLNFRIIRPVQQLGFRLEYSHLHSLNGVSSISGSEAANLFSGALVYQFGFEKEIKRKED